MKGLLGSFLALLSLVSVNSYAALSGPSTSSSGNYTLSWTENGKNYCFHRDMDYAYELRESINGAAYTTTQIVSESAKNYSFTNKPAGTYRYYLRSRWCNYSVSEKYSWSETPEITVTVTEAAPSSAPSISGSSSSTGGDVHLTWNSISGASTYRIQERNYTSNSSWVTRQNTSSRTFRVTNKSTARYQYRVQACNTGGCSSYSSTKTLRFVNPPGNISSITFPTSTWYGSTPRTTWTSVSGESYYKFGVRNSSSTYWFYDTQITPSGSSTEEHSLSLAANSYYFRVQACRNFESIESCSTTRQSSLVTVVPPPGTPGSFTAPSTVSGNFSISWGGASGSPSGYTLQRSVNGGSYSTIGSGYTSRSYTQSSVAVGTYRYRVRAYRSSTSNYSGWRYSDTITAARPSTPGTPTGPTADDDGSFTISWSSMSNTTSYRLERRLGSGSFSQIYSGSATSYAQSSLSTGVYDYRVRACNALGCGSYSGIREVDVARAPSMPSFNAIPTNHGASSLNVSWGAVSGANSRYDFDYSRNGGSSWNGTTDGTSTSRSVSTSTQGSYRFRVRACSRADSNETCSGYRYSSTITVQGIPSVPTITEKPSTVFRPFEFSFSSSSNTAYFEVSKQGSSAAPTRVNTSNGTGSFNETTPLLGYQFYLVSACNSAGYCSGTENTGPINGVAVSGVPSLTAPPIASSTGDFEVRWSTSGVQNTSHYRVQESANGGGWSYTGGDVEAPRVDLDVQNKSTGTYRYRVQACNYFNCGSFSPARSIDVAEAPYAPLKFSIYRYSGVEGEDVRITYNWDSSQPAAGRSADVFEIGYRDSNGNWQTQDSTQQPNHYWVYAPSSTQYRIRGCNIHGAAKACAANWVYSELFQVYDVEISDHSLGRYNLSAPRFVDGMGFDVSWRLLDYPGRYRYLLVQTEYPENGDSITTVIMDGLPEDFGDFNTHNSYYVNFPAEGSRFTYAICALDDSTNRCIDDYLEPMGYNAYVIPESTTVSSSSLPRGDAVGSIPYTTGVDRKGYATVSVPLQVPASRGTLQPSLSLEYNSAGSQQRNRKNRSTSLFDSGWSLSGFSEIHRCRKGEPDNRFTIRTNHTVTATGTSYTTEHFHDPLRQRPWVNYASPDENITSTYGESTEVDSLCMDDQLLVLVEGEHLKTGAVYRTQEDSFKTITIQSSPSFGDWDTCDGGIRFEVRHPDGRVSTYGGSATTQVCLTGETQYSKWALSSLIDTHGNKMAFNYLIRNYRLNGDAAFGDWNATKQISSFLDTERWYVNGYNLPDSENETFLRFLPVSISYPGGTVYFNNIGPDESSSSITMAGSNGDSHTYRINRDVVSGDITSIVQGEEGHELPPLIFGYERFSAADHGDYLVTVDDGLGMQTSFEYYKTSNSWGARYADNAGNFAESDDLGNSAMFEEVPWVPSDLVESFADNQEYFKNEADSVVVTRHSKTDTSGNVLSSLSYRYGDSGLYSNHGFGELGKGLVRATDDITGITTYTAYKLLPPLSGRVEYEVQYDGLFMAGKTPIYEQYNEYDVHEFSPAHHSNASDAPGTPLVPELVRSVVYNYDNDQFVGGSLTTYSANYMNDRRVGGNDAFVGVKTSETTTTALFNAGNNGSVPIENLQNPTGVVNFVEDTKIFTNYCHYCVNSQSFYEPTRLHFPSSQSTTRYDGAPGASGVTSSTQTVTRTMWQDTYAVRDETVFPNDPNLQLTTSYSYDEDGYLAQKTVSGANVASRSTWFHGYKKGPTPNYITNPLGHQVTNSRYDSRSNTPMVTYGPNGEKTEKIFDDFGRVIQTIDVHGNTTNVSYLNSDEAAGICSDVNHANGILNVNVAIGYAKVVTPEGDFAPTTEQCFDQFDRPVLTRTEGFETNEVFSVHTVYDDRGYAVLQSLPYANINDRQYVVSEYDTVTGRKIREDRPDGSQTQWRYDVVSGFQRTLTVDTVLEEDGTFIKTRAKYSVFNGAGQLLNSTDGIVSGEDFTDRINDFNIETAIAGQSSDTTQAVTTTYEYDALGNVVTATVYDGTCGIVVTSPTNQSCAKTTTTVSYDDAGNRLEMTGPNVGTVTFTYSALGELLSTTDAEGNVTTHQYDVLGRPTVKQTEEQTFNYYYDSKVLGQPDYITNNDGYTETYEYGDGNNPWVPNEIIESITVAGDTYDNTSYISYDERGRVATQTYGSGIEVQYNHNHRGDVVSVTETSTGKVLHEVTDIGAFGVKRTELGNGAIIEKDYDPLTGFNVGLSHYRTTSGGSESPFFTQEYQWDSSGNLRERSVNRNGGSTTTETFGYDNHDRITYAQTQASNDSRRLEYSYNNLGNILSKTSDHALDTQVENYSYGDMFGCNNVVRPHAVTSVDINGYNATLCYNDNGYITSYDLEDESKTIEYNNFGQPLSIVVEDKSSGNLVASDEFLYGPKGNRYFKESKWREGSSTYTRKVIYFSDGSEQTYVDSKEGKDYTHLNKVAISGNIYHIQEVGISTSDKLEYLHHDHLGSVIAVTTEELESSATPAQENGFDPFGSRRSKDWLSEISTTDLSFILDNPETTTNRGFTGHEHLDRTGFIHMNGRVYDPVIGRFLTPDPLVQAPTLSQSWNRYTYGFNNPMRYTDPTGYSSKGTSGKEETSKKLSRKQRRLKEAAMKACKNGCDLKITEKGDIVVIDSEGNDISETEGGAAFGAIVAGEFMSATKQLAGGSGSSLASSEQIGTSEGESKGGIWEQTKKYWGKHFTDIKDGLSNMMNPGGSFSGGYGGGLNVCVLSACGDVQLGAGVSLDFNNLGNSKLFFQFSTAVGAGLGFGIGISTGASISKSPDQIASGWSASDSGTIFGFGVFPAFGAVAGPSGSLSIDYKDGAMAAGGYGGVGVGIGYGGAAIGTRIQVNYGSPSFNDVFGF